MIEHDKAEIIELLNLYGLAIDTHRWDLFDRIFTQDVTFDLGPAGVVWTDLATAKRDLDGFHKTLDNHQHAMTNHLVHIDGDKAYAFTYGIGVLVREAAEGGPAYLWRGWYDDELIRTDLGWRIRRRVARLVYWSGNALVQQPVYNQHPVMTTYVLRREGEAGKIGFLQAISAK
jgi:hypothetical protein